jgi:hypothetical protein
MTPELIHRDECSEIYLGDSLDPSNVATIMTDRKATALIFDAPFSAQTHEGHAGGKLTADRAAGYGRTENPNRKREAAYSRRKAAKGESGRRDIEYPFWTASDVENFVDIWVPHSDGWIVSITDDVLGPTWRAEFKGAGLLPFASIPLVETGSRVRMNGDGPSNWSCHVYVARPRHEPYSSYGTLPGAYIQPGERKMNSRGGSVRITGGKPLLSMLAIVRDYSRPGDLVVDPTCGGGTTGAAAKILGRRFIGIDNNRERAELSARLIAETREQTILIRDVPEMTQPDLFEVTE